MTFSPLTGGCSEGLDAFILFFKHVVQYYEVLSVVRTKRSGAFIQNRVHKKHMITNTCYTGQQHDMIKEARGFRDSNNDIAIDRSIPPIGGSKHEELTTMI